MVDPRKIAKYLGLKLPYEIVLVSHKVIDPRDSEKKYKSKGSLACYYDMRYDDDVIAYHLIHIYLHNMKKDMVRNNIEILIAHELIHAWQSEFGFTDNHGDSFQSAAAAVESKFKLTNLYLPCTDME